MRGSAGDVLRDVADAHAVALLSAAEQIEVAFSSGGLAFAAKGQPHALSSVVARLHVRSQAIALSGDAPRPWTVEIGGSSELASGLERLRSGSRRFRWQPEDLGTFAAAALWTYLTMPLLLGVADRVERGADRGGLRRLRVTLPPSVAGHAKAHVLHVGPDGLIHRHDYTAVAFGRWARAAQSVRRYERFDGVPVGTRRRVVPRLGRPLPAPTLVWIRIDALRLVPPRPAEP